MSSLCAHIEERGYVMPWMTAVRLDGHIVTYGDLYERVCAYDDVIARNSLSENASITAALMSFLPDHLRALDPVAQARWVSDAIAWLSRDLDGANAYVAAV